MFGSELPAVDIVGIHAAGAGHGCAAQEDQRRGARLLHQRLRVAKPRHDDAAHAHSVKRRAGCFPCAHDMHFDAIACIGCGGDDAKHDVRIVFTAGEMRAGGQHEHKGAPAAAAQRPRKLIHAIAAGACHAFDARTGGRLDMRRRGWIQRARHRDHRHARPPRDIPRR